MLRLTHHTRACVLLGKESGKAISGLPVGREIGVGGRDCFLP